MNLSYRKLYGAHIVVESTVNNCHCVSVTTSVRMFKDYFMYGLSGKLWALLPYLYITQIHIFSIGQERMAVDKIF